MTNTTRSSSPTDTASDVGDTARQSGAEVAGHAADQAQRVAGTATEQAKQVATTATDQARELVEQAQSRLEEEASSQNEKVVTGLRALADELAAMTDHDGPVGLASDLAIRGKGYAQSTADWLDGREPGDLVNELRGLARRRPGAFLAGALVAGVVAGRLTRGVTAAVKDEHESSTSATPRGSEQTPGSQQTFGYNGLSAPAAYEPIGYEPTGYEPTGYEPTGLSAGAAAYTPQTTEFDVTTTYESASAVGVSEGFAPVPQSQPGLDPRLDEPSVPPFRTVHNP